MRRLLLTLLTIAIPCSLPAQQTLLHADGTLPSFEVATIKPGTYWTGSGPLGSSSAMWLPTGIMTMRQFIAVAYGQFQLIGVTPPRVYGGPDWLDHDHYSTQVKIPNDIFSAWKTMSEEQKRKQFDLMEQSLLAQRFHLKVHFEMRETAVYELHVAKGGLKLKPDATDDLPGSSGAAASSRGVKIAMKHVTMAELSEQIVGMVDRPVVDKTMLPGKYSFDLLVSPVGTGFEGKPANRNGQPFDSTSDAPTLPSAMKDLGLELVPVKGQVEAVIIDSIDRPSEN